MIIQAFGDLHFRDTRPRVRRDDYGAEAVRKVEWSLQEADRRGLQDRVIILPGDIFENCRASYRLMATVAALFRGRNVLVVPGQHDQRYHSNDLSNIPLMVLVRAGVFILLGSEGEAFWGPSGRYVRIKGAGFGEEIPSPDKSPEVLLNVLVTHRMVIKDTRLYPDQTAYSWSRTLLKESGYNLIVSGDNHGKFTDGYQFKKDGLRILVNAGSLMRSRKDQADHEPATFLFDTETGDLEEVLIPVRPFSEVVDLEAEETADEFDARAEAFAAALEDSGEEAGLDFVENVQPYMAGNDVRPGVQGVVWEAIRRAQEEMETEEKE